VVRQIDARLEKIYLINKVGLILGVMILLTVGPLRAQVFTPEAFIQQVKQYHPVAKQAGIQVLKANADLQSARGGFDPAFNYEGSNKTFDGKNYYFYNNPELKIPTALGGLDIKTGLESNGLANALQKPMLEAPDVIMIGEIRDINTMQQAIAYAETGHLCLSTLHANNANQTLDRIINFYPETARQQVLTDLSLNLKAVVSQRLLKSTDPNAKRIPAVEILLSSPFVADMIAKGEISAIKESMKHSTDLGMQTFDEALFKLYASKKISYQDAIDVADSRTDLALRIRLEGMTPESAQGDVLQMQDDAEHAAPDT